MTDTQVPNNQPAVDARLDRLETMIQALTASLQRSVVPSTPVNAVRPLPPIPELPRSHGLAPRSLFGSARSATPALQTYTRPSLPLSTTTDDEEKLQADRAMASTTSEPARPARSRKAVPPTKWKGTPQDPAAKTFLYSSRIYLTLTCEGEPEDVLVNTFATLLEGSALNWFMNLQSRADRDGRALTLTEVFDAFLKTYESDSSRRLADLQLSSLVYGEGQCKTLTALDVEFDRLARELCDGSGGVYDDAANILLASRYQEVVRKGNLALWEKAAESMPYTLEEWKEAVKMAYAISQTKAAAAKLYPTRGGYPSRSAFPTSSTSSSFSSHRPASVAVQHVQAQGGQTEAETETYQEGEEELNAPPEQIQQIKAKTARPMNKATDGRRWGDHLSSDQRSRLMKQGKCWLCYQRGHVASRCPDKDKAGTRRQPTSEDLNA